MSRQLTIIVLLAVVVGCGKSPAAKTKSVMTLQEVPANIMSAAQKKEPGVKFDKVIRTADGIYEVQGKTKTGKILEVEVSETGDVLKVE